MNPTSTSMIEYDPTDPETGTNKTETGNEENSLEEAKETIAKAGSDGGQQVRWAVCAVALLSLALF